MTDSIHKQIPEQLATLAAAADAEATVETNTDEPEEIPEGGLVIIRDGNPKPVVETLGGFDDVYMTCTFPAEVYVVGGTAATRDARYDALLQALAGAWLARDENGQRSLGGLVYGVIIDRPEPMTEPREGSAACKMGTIQVTVEYTAPSTLG